MNNSPSQESTQLALSATPATRLVRHSRKALLLGLCGRDGGFFDEPSTGFFDPPGLWGRYNRDTTRLGLLFLYAESMGVVYFGGSIDWHRWQSHGVSGYNGR